MTRRKPQPQPVGRPRLDRDDPADPTERHTLTMRRSEWAYLRRHGRTLSEGARVVVREHIALSVTAVDQREVKSLKQQVGLLQAGNMTLARILGILQDDSQQQEVEYDNQES